MQVVVHNSEIYERTTVRYVLFAGFFCSLIILSIIYQNYVGAIVTCLLLWWYLFFSISNAQPIPISLYNTHLQIWAKSHPRSSIQWFKIEVKDKEHNINNILFVIQGKNHIHTFKDEPQNIKDFVVELSDYIPMLHTVPDSAMNQLARSLKI